MRAREAHDVVHGEEIGCVIERGDQLELMRQRFARALRNAAGIAPCCARLNESLERLLRRRIAFAQFFRIAMLEFVEAELEAVEEADGFGDRLRRLGEQPRHFAWGFEMTLGVGLGEKTRGLERGPLADAGEDVGERAPLGRMHERVIGRDQRRLNRAREAHAPREPAAHVGVIDEARADPQTLAEGLAQAGEGRIVSPSGRRRRMRASLTPNPSPMRGEGRHRHDLQALAALQKVVELEPAFAFRRALVSLGQNPAEPAVSRAIPWIDERIRGAVDEGEPRAGNDPRGAHRLGVLARERMRAHDARERVAVGDPDPSEPELGGALDHLLGMRGAAQKREIRGSRQFGEKRLSADQGPLPATRSDDGPRPRSSDRNKDRTLLGRNTSTRLARAIWSPLSRPIAFAKRALGMSPRARDAKFG